MHRYHVTVEDQTQIVEAKSALDAIVNLLNSLGLRYEFTNVKVIDLGECQACLSFI